MSAKTATKKNEAEVKREFTLDRAMVFWIYSSKDKKSKYLSGRTEEGTKLIGFFNNEKQNPKEPDIRLYAKDNENSYSKEVYCSLWVNATQNGKKYLSGRLNGKRLVGFFNSMAEIDGVNPYINLYFSEDSKPEEKKEDVIDQPESMKQTKFEEIPNDNDLPF